MQGVEVPRKQVSCSPNPDFARRRLSVQAPAAVWGMYIYIYTHKYIYIYIYIYRVQGRGLGSKFPITVLLAEIVMS